MFKSKAFLAGITLALLVVYSPLAAVKGDTGKDTGVVTQVPSEVPDGVLGYYTTDGGKTFIPIKEQKGVAERIPSGTSKEEFMEAHRMSPEAEAAIVHMVPPGSIIIDGILYEPEQIHLFDGKQLGFAMGDDGQLYAFTSFAALEDFMNGQSEALAPLFEPPPEYCVFYEFANFDYIDRWLWVLPGVTIHSLSIFCINDDISSMKIRPYAANGSTLFEHDNLQGDYLPANAGTEWENLGYFDNRASSLVVWPR
jgi:hypothetical protein